MQTVIQLGKIKIGGMHPFVLIAGPCVIESKISALKIAKALRDVAWQARIPFVFKASYDKANRTSLNSFRGPGLQKGLAILSDIKKELNVAVLSDVHSVEEADQASSVLDILQIPAFLCRQTDLVLAAAKTQKIINIKKGQFLAPWDITQVVRKIESTGNKKILLTERGVSFGYNQLISDFRSLEIMAKTGYPVVYDVTHSVQKPGGLGKASDGNREFVPLLARCAAAAGISGLFLEVHPRPHQALSDGPNSYPLKKLKKLLKELKAIDQIVKNKKKIKES